MTCLSPARVSRARFSASRVINDPEYRGLKEHLIESTGMAFYSDRDELMSAVISERISDLGLDDCSSYVKFLAQGAPGAGEREVLIGQLTIGETYFFRDEAQFAALRDIVIPDILQRNRLFKRLRIWSAGCATGAEPYSLAILLAHELADRIAGWEVVIHATDLNRDYLARAEQGKFREWALRGVSDAMKRECFSKQDGLWVIHPRFQKCINFHYMNLAESGRTPPFEGAFDLILCRNVMIYFTADVNRRLIEKLHASLTPGGWLAVGACEGGPAAVKGFRVVDVPDARVYQKAAPASLPRVPVPVETVAAPQPAARALVAPLPGLARGDVETLRQLADRGDWQAATGYARRLLAQDQMDPATHCYGAMIFENLGMAAESERSLRHAIYLDRSFAQAHYHLGLALKRDRQINASARAFESVLMVLAGLPGHAMVTAGPGVATKELKELAKMHLEGSAG